MKRVIKQYQKGFTLIEVLVIMSIMGVVGTVIASIFTISLRTSRKATYITTVRQNGNYAIAQMTRQIRYAQSFDGLEDPVGSNTYAVDTTCVGATTIRKKLKVTNFDGGSTIFTCNEATDTIASTSATFGSTPVNLLVGTTNSPVNLQNCNLSCTRPSIDSPPIVTISFELSDNASGDTFVEGKVSKILFQTSVTPRNH